MSRSPLRDAPTPFRGDRDYEEASTLRTEPAPFATWAPSCLGGAHRRCLLDADHCGCPHHRDEAPPDYVTHIAPVTFPCPACTDTFPTVRARATHLTEAHPVSTRFEIVV